MAELVTACEAGYFAEVERLFKLHGNEPYRFNGRVYISAKNAGLCKAAHYGYLRIVKFLVENGADVHADDDWPLRYAVWKGHYSVVEYLMQNDANPNANCKEAFRDAKGNDTMLSLLKGTKNYNSIVKMYKQLDVSMTDYLSVMQKLGVTIKSADISDMNLEVLDLEPQDLHSFLKFIYENCKETDVSQFYKLVENNVDEMIPEFWEWFFAIPNLDLENYTKLLKVFAKFQVPKLRKRVLELETEVQELKKEAPTRQIAKLKLEDM